MGRRGTYKYAYTATFFCYVCTTSYECHITPRVAGHHKVAGAVYHKKAPAISGKVELGEEGLGKDERDVFAYNISW